MNVYTFLGSGTEDDPFRITNLEDLKVLSENAELWGHSYYFRQTKNIDASETKDWNDGLGFSPIGNSTERFYGNYNGGGNTIDSLYINRSDEDNVGLFGVVEDTKIRSLTITNSVIKGKGNVGVLVGAVYSSDINYSYTAGSVTGSTNVGGMVGYNFRSNLKHSYSTGSVGGTSCVGGLVGYNMFDKYYENITKFVKSRIDYCYSTGRVKGIKNIGGIVGYNSSSIVTNSYSTGSVTGSLSVGGLVGSNTKYYQENLWEQYAYWIDPYYVESEIDNCYSVSLVSGNSDVGGVVGYNESDISGCYYNETVSTSNDDENGNPVTTAQLQSLSTFSGWDFAGLSSDGTDDIWAISSYLNEGYPVLTWEIDDFSVPELLSTAVTLNDNGTSATLTSGFSYLGMANPVAYGFCYATDEEVPDILASEIIDLGAVNGYEEAGEFSGEMQNVDENSTYYIRAYAINAADTVYSSNVLMISDNNVYEMGVDLEVFTSIEDEGEQAIVIYPNPVSSILYVDNAGGIAVIYNLAGQQVIYHDLDESNAIDLSELKGGLYLLQVDKKTFKVVKK